VRQVYVVRQEDGELASDPATTAKLPPGHLLFGQGVLVSAGEEKLQLHKHPAIEQKADK
jgi:hypothetical protein